MTTLSNHADIDSKSQTVESFDVPCTVALFSHFNFRTNGLIMYDKESTLCSANLNTQPASRRGHQSAETVLAINRGECAFDEKALNAVNLGYRALLVVDASEPSPGAAAVPFPMGTSNNDFRSTIPVLMVRKESIDFIFDDGNNSNCALVGDSKTCSIQSTDVKISLFFNKAVAEGSGHGSSVGAWRSSMEKAPVLIGRVGLCVLCVFLIWATVSHSSRSSASGNNGSEEPSSRHDVKTLPDGAATGSASAVATSMPPNSMTSTPGQEGVGLRQYVGGIFFFLVPYIIVLLFAAACRLGTYRVLMAEGFAEYHHQETDEKVFASLTQAVEKDWRAYFLGPDVVRRLRLSPENYGDTLFIHPPFFVYISMFLVRYCGLSLPSVSLVFHLGVMLLLPLMVRFCGFDVRDQWRRHRRDRLQDKDGLSHNVSSHSYDEDDVVAPPRTSISEYYSEGAVALWALVIYVFDPLAFFCSQKFWIDNALLFAVTAAATIHMGTWRRQAARRGRSRGMLAVRAFASGFAYGLLVLNCKITGLAQLPFLLLWMFVSMIEVVSFGTILAFCFLPYLVGAALAYAPWAVLYHMHTGRWLPNAWPSASMLQASAFLRLAVNKPVTFYLEQLLEFSPMQVLGLAFGIAVSARYLGKHLWQFLHCNSRRSRINGDNFVAYGGSGHVTALLAWPVAFIAGVTLIGATGGGYQTRFLLPILPATSVLGARCVHRACSIRDGNSTSLAAVHVLASVALAYCSMHCLYYGMLFPNLFADLDMSMFSVLSNVLAAPYSPMGSTHSMQEMLKYIAHFGLHLQAKASSP